MDIKVNDTIWSEYFGCWIRIVKINSDEDWEFVRPYDHIALKAKTPLSWFWKNSVVTRNKARIN